MKKNGFLAQTLDILIKIFFAFIIVFSFYFVTLFVNSFAFDYFIFPLVAILTIFVCGVNVGKSLEKLKTNESIGFFTRKKNNKNNDYSSEVTEFIVRDNNREITNKKILKEVKEGNQVHIKVFNYNDIFDEEESE